MIRIGEFSKMSKVTIKALRYYEEEGLIYPKYIDETNGYRYYESSQLLDISRIISLKQIGLTIDEIKRIIINHEDINSLLLLKKEELEKAILNHSYQLSKINYLLKEKSVKEEIFEKIIPAYYVYYTEGVIKEYSKISELILKSGEECLKLNPDIVCQEPEYCYVNYLDKEYKEKDIKVRYAQAVIKGKKEFIESDNIKFMDIKETKCICIYHKGPYNNIGISYSKILKYIEENKLETTDYSRECYIDGIWNKDDENDYLTEIQVPIKWVIYGVWF